MIIRTFFNRLEGNHAQYNVVDRATLLDAQAHPEKHKDRISAFEVFLHGLFMQKPEYNDFCPCSKSIWNGQTQVTVTVPKGL